MIKILKTYMSTNFEVNIQRQIHNLSDENYRR